jgi:uncharacterized damage-inducible protein DinB
VSTLLDHHRLLARYNRWFNEALFDACEKLDDAARRQDRGAFFGSIHGTLNHILWGDVLWMRRFAAVVPLPDGSKMPTVPEGARHATIVHDEWAQLREARSAFDEMIVQWLDGMPAEAPAASLDYVTTNGEKRSLPLWLAVTHFFNHQTHHRGQVTTLLSQCGIDPGVTDLVAMPR